MKCWLSMFSGKEIATDCPEVNCGLWDKKLNQCRALTYFQSYFQVQTLMLRQQTILNELKEED